MTKLRVVHAFSAGGVVYRPLSSSHIPMSQSADPPGDDPPGGELAFEVVLVGFPAEDLWVLPKGTPEAGETPEATAVREVREETGVLPRIVGDLGSISYWFTRRGTRFRKEVRHFLMEAVGGDVDGHDAEYDEARWFPLAEAIARLRHQNEADVLRRASGLFARGDRPGRAGDPRADAEGR